MEDLTFMNSVHFEKKPREKRFNNEGGKKEEKERRKGRKRKQLRLG